MDENNSAVGTEDLGDIDYFEGWDDDPGTEADEVGGEEAEETGAAEEQQDQQPEEATEDKAEEETGEKTEPEERKAESRSWKLKHNGEEVDADEAKMVELAQKGLDYDRVRGERDTFKNEHPKYADYEKFLGEMAESAGTDVPGLIENVRASLLVKKAKEEGRTLSEAAAIKQVRESANAAAKQGQAEADKRTAAIKAFVAAHPDVKADQIPIDVLREGMERADLVGAYDAWENKQLKEKLDAAQKELETLKQNQKNKERSTGSKKSAGAKAVDKWFDGWPDD